MYPDKDDMFNCRDNFSTAEYATELMRKGYMCSGSVVMAYARAFGFEKELAARISSGFAGGMAQGKTCGAVTGAVMVIGLKYGAGMVRDQYAKDLCFQMTQEFFHRFESRRRTTECQQIHRLNHINPTDPELSRKLRKSGICYGVVQDAVGIIEELFHDEDLQSA